MSKTLGGFQFVRQGVKYDYCFEQSIQCLCDFCDEVSVLEIGSDDGTREIIERLKNKNPNLMVMNWPIQSWQSVHGKTKLSYFQNMALKMLRTDYQFLLQADEILHEKSYSKVREAIETGANGFLCTRINLWKSPFLKLNVPQERKPCSTEVIRLTKTGYDTWDDGENIYAQATTDFLKDIRIYHMGFVRKREIHKEKIIEMQENVFQCGHDSKLDGHDTFKPELWFEDSDLSPIDEPLPLIIQEWAKERVYE